MVCVYPITLQDPKSAAIYTVPCGRCISCRVNKTEEWARRMIHELRSNDGVGIFLTLTYAPEYLPVKGLCKRDLQLFFKKLRKKIYPQKIRYYACGEYGEDYGRPHYHAIIFGLSLSTWEKLSPTWTYGRIYVGTVTYDSCRYTAKYLQKVRSISDPLYQNLNREFSLSSRRPGLGVNFSKKYLDNWLKIGYIVHKGIKYPIPRTYLTRIPDNEMVLLRDRKSSAVFNNSRKEAIERGITDYQLQDNQRVYRKNQEKNIFAKLSLKKGGFN